MTALYQGASKGIAFATTRLAVGAQAVRDLIVQAWEESASTPIGYPMVTSKAGRCERRGRCSARTKWL